LKLKIFWKNKSKDTDFLLDSKKQPNLKKLIRYDEKFNNKRKVLFESLLASIIRFSPRLLYPPVIKVSTAILPDFTYAFEKIKEAKGRDIHWLCHHFYQYISNNSDILSEYTGSNETKIPSSVDAIKKFIDWIYSILKNTDSRKAYLQLLLIREYGNFFIRPYSHLPQFQKLNDGRGLQIIPEGFGDSSSKFKMYELWNQSRAHWPTNNLEHSRISTQHTIRAKKSRQLGIFSSETDKIPQKFKKDFPEVALHLPGKNLWRVISTSSFAVKARYQLDMPLISGQSGGIALLLIPAIVMGRLNREELLYFNLNALSYMIGNGHHSTHEFKPVWQTFNIPYVDGDYSSIFPSGLVQAHPELLELQNHFHDLLPF
jgi:hypothetical protein